MKQKIDSVINKIERIPVSGVNAILMGDALKELMIIRQELPEETEEKPGDQPEEGEENVNSND